MLEYVIIITFKVLLYLVLFKLTYIYINNIIIFKSCVFNYYEYIDSSIWITSTLFVLHIW